MAFKLNEPETEYRIIDPNLSSVGWNTVESAYVHKQFPITQGRIIGKNRREKPLKADYVLRYKNRILAVIEAKRQELSHRDGVGQAKKYADMLQIRFAYSTNGDRIYEIDMHLGVEGEVEKFPTPEELWEMNYPTSKENYKIEISSWKDKILSVPFEDRGGTWKLRYYQEIAITKVAEAIADKKDRILLTLATGTGKTAIAFQIAWKLFHSRWNLNRDGKRQPRILFLADRNILANQAFNSFSSFPEDALVRIKPSEIRKNKKVPTNGSIFFTIFQTFMSGGSTGSPTAEDIEENGYTTGSPTVQYQEVQEQEIEFDEISINENSYGYMYILQCADGSFYTGSTTELTLRIQQHKNGVGANFTTKHLPVKLVYYETFDRIDEAFAREKQIQKWRRAKKIALIQGDIEKLKQLLKSKTMPKLGESVPKHINSLPELVDSVPELVDSVPELVDSVPELVDSVPELVEGKSPYFGEYPPDFFDMIVIDECHRGGANDESSWRDIMDYFKPAVQLGLTATPKRKDNADTYKYFGEPVYTYSLKQGINDGFLTPFRVVEIDNLLSEYEYNDNDEIIDGEIDPDKIYKEGDFNRNIISEERELLRVKTFLKMINQNHKTLVFCSTQVHAALIRDLINQNADSTNPNYCHRVTANDGALGEEYLKQFQNNELTIPTILTTSFKLSTGVDAPEVKNIILLRPVKSIIEFKQIVGRGTRLFDSKDYFTIYDFVKARERFEDPEWDGEPIEKISSGRGKELCIDCGKKPCECNTINPQICELCGTYPCICEKPRNIVRIKLSDNTIRDIKPVMGTSFWDPDGKPISAEEFMKKLFGDIPSLFKDENELREIWSKPDTRRELLNRLEEKGYTEDQLNELKKLVNGIDSDVYDVLNYIAYHKEILTRAVRANNATINLNEYDLKIIEFLNFVLSQYTEVGVSELDDKKLPDLLEIKYGSLSDAKTKLGDLKYIRNTFIDFQKYIYK
jgi:type I restriction enzyme R subunit